MLDLLDLPELPNNELSTRRSSLQQQLVAHDLSGVLLHSRVEQYYYAGIAIDGLLWVSQDDSKLLVRRNIPLVKSATDLENIIPFGSLRNLKSTLSVSDGVKVGFEAEILPFSYATYLSKVFNPTALVGADSLLRTIRAVKSPYEIQQMKICGKQVADSMTFASEIIKEGMTEMEVATKIDSFLREKGMVNNIPVRAFGQGMASLAYVLSGKNSTFYNTMFSAYTGKGTSSILPLGPTLKKLVAHESISIDTTASANGYITDSTRIFSIGSLSQELMDAHAATVEILEFIEKKLVPSTLMGDLYNQVLSFADELGYADFLQGPKGDQTKFIGHSIGLELDEPPVLAIGSKDQLKANNVIAIEPKIILPDGSVGIENTYQITSDGPVNLTPSKNFFLLD
ncbi:MAG: aminopeptidase P family protein [Candidatus Heimdallarchaeota archaeon]|nr:aminopeptidase P family protein [Candidatus Heimdallarchaeota archaeon]MCK5048870.1 aminopeptidase P family protein [Candidatus Heimdallarchaeota archaeon]